MDMSLMKKGTSFLRDKELVQGRDLVNVTLGSGVGAYFK